ncbi:F-box family protein [Striga asiatica]|uniref:F-box family protein n=1 Tax=Striga asiatica TaxID=4170 RepID=A0A5A7PJI5_STRAF|nr:F-box family protein [Striga asiatica]
MSDIPPEAMTDVPTQLPELLSPWTLPFDLAEVILIRLPVKTLKRFRGVESSWRALIDSEKFAKAHLKHSLTSNSNRNIISGVLGFQWMGLDSLDGARSIELEYEYDKRHMHAVSNSINGLFVVTREPEPPILWNPFAREHKVLPKCPIDFPLNFPLVSSCYCDITHGFGYDSENDDYKLVKVMWFRNRDAWLASEEWIYSLKLNSWRRTMGTFYRGPWPTHVEGVLHALVRTGWGPGLSDTKIMGFNIVSERDREVAMPKADEKGLVHLKLDLFDGRLLALFCTYASDVVVWVMEEYGVKESWVPLITTRIEKDGFIWPIAYTKNFDKILVNCSGRSLALFGVRSPSVEHFALPSGVWNKLCVETLISPQGWNRKDSKEESSTKDHIEDGGNINNGNETMKNNGSERHSIRPLSAYLALCSSNVCLGDRSLHRVPMLLYFFQCRNVSLNVISSSSLTLVLALERAVICGNFPGYSFEHVWKALDGEAAGLELGTVFFGLAGDLGGSYFGVSGRTVFLRARDGDAMKARDGEAMKARDGDAAGEKVGLVFFVLAGSDFAESFFGLSV